MMPHLVVEVCDVDQMMVKVVKVVFRTVVSKHLAENNKVVVEQQISVGVGKREDFGSSTCFRSRNEWRTQSIERCYKMGNGKNRERK
jgi:hypothetical protein